jgi:hypothetical protein
MRYTILHIYNVVEHIDMLSIGILQQSCYTVLVLPTLLGSDFEVLGHLWWCDYVMVEADRLPPSILDIYKEFEHIYIIEMLSIGIHQHPSYTVTINPSCLRFWGSGSLVESKWCQHVVVWRFCPSCQCAWPFNWREGPPLLHTYRQVASASALLPMQSCQCAWPLNWRDEHPSLHTHRQVASVSALLPMQSASQ